MNYYNYYSKDGVTVVTMLDSRRALMNGEYPVKVRVTYTRKRIYLPTGKSLSQQDWNKLPIARSSILSSTRKDIENSFMLVQSAVEKLLYEGDFSIENLEDLLKGRSVGTKEDVVSYISRIETELAAEERIGNLGFYQQLKLLMIKFKGEHVPFKVVTPKWLNSFETFLREEQGLRQSTIAMRMRTLRAVYNRAIKDRIAKQKDYPFGEGKYVFQEGEGRKMALTIEEIGAVARYETEEPDFVKYRDYWLFLYYANGLNITDFAKLKYSDIIDGEFYVIRTKTSRTSRTQKNIRVPITAPMQEIIDKYGNIDKAGYIFPILNDNDNAKRIRDKVQILTRSINRRMARLSESLGIKKITTYTARHSFATVLKRAGVPISYISESLGHSSIQTTTHYLDSFDKDERKKNAEILTRF